MIRVITEQNRLRKLHVCLTQVYIYIYIYSACRVSQETFTKLSLEYFLPSRSTRV